MLRSEKKVKQQIDDIRFLGEHFFVPVGTMDTSTPAKAEISNICHRIRENLPLIGAFEKVAQKYPTYVGYDAQNDAVRSGTYYRNLVLMHQAADDSSMSFIQAYCHEMTHLYQDCSGVLRQFEVPKAEELVDFLAHNLMLESAALATEICCLYYLSHHAALAEEFDEVADYYDEYMSEQAGRRALYGHVMAAMDGQKVNKLADMKPAWQALFQAFFEPDSPFVGHYINGFIRSVDARANLRDKEGRSGTATRAWGDLKAMEKITTLPGDWGAVFAKQALPILSRVVRASILQEKHQPLITFAQETMQRQQAGGQKNAPSPA